MKAGKAYISSLGTTGLLVACSVLLLTVVGAIVAFDRWPTSSSAVEAEAVVLGPEPVENRTVAPERSRARAERRATRARARAERRGAARTAARRRVQAGEGASALPSGPGGVSNLPPPGAVPGDGSGGTGSGGPRGPQPGGGQPAPSGGGTGPLDQAVTGVNPQAGQTVAGVGQAVEQALETPLGTPATGIAP